VTARKNHRRTRRIGRTRRIRPGRISPKEAKERQALILKVATEEYLAKGFQRANLTAIAKRCRVSKMTIYRLFDSKEKLFFHIAVAGVSRFTYDLLEALRADRPFKDVIRALVELMVESTSDAPTNALLRLAVSERERFPSIGRMVLKQSLKLIRPLSAYLLSSPRKPKLTEAQALRLAYHLMSMATGAFGCLMVDPAELFGNRTAWIDSVTRIFVEPFPVARTGPSLKRLIS